MTDALISHIRWQDEQLSALQVGAVGRSVY
jgi:hypothetical protein